MHHGITQDAIDAGLVAFAVGFQLALVNGIIGVFLRCDVLHDQADRIDDMTMRITSREGGAGLLCVAASSNMGY